MTGAGLILAGFGFSSAANGTCAGIIHPGFVCNTVRHTGAPTGSARATGRHSAIVGVVLRPRDPSSSDRDYPNPRGCFQPSTYFLSSRFQGGLDIVFGVVFLSSCCDWMFHIVGWLWGGEPSELYGDAIPM